LDNLYGFRIVLLCLTIFSPATTREQATTIDIRVLLNALARVLLLRLISPVLFLLLILLLVY